MIPNPWVSPQPPHPTVTHPSDRCMISTRRLSVITPWDMWELYSLSLGLMQTCAFLEYWFISMIYLQFKDLRCKARCSGLLYIHVVYVWINRSLPCTVCTWVGFFNTFKLSLRFYISYQFLFVFIFFTFN